MHRTARLRSALALAPLLVVFSGAPLLASPPPNVTIAVHNESGATLTKFFAITRYRTAGNSYNVTSIDFAPVASKSWSSGTLNHAWEQADTTNADIEVRFSDGRSQNLQYSTFNGYWGVTMCGNCAVEFKAEWRDATLHYTVW